MVDCLKDFNSDEEYSTVVSETPAVCRTAKCLLGIDEAGRGPVLGPMVYACCFLPADHEQKLKELKVADSKTLKEEERSALFQLISDNSSFIGYRAIVISAAYISKSMLARDKTSLNEISHNAAAELIRGAQDSGVLVSEIFVDTVGPPASYEAKLSGQFPHCKVTVAKQADSKFAVVSAASICAKVIRDTILSKCQSVLQDRLSKGPIQLGSGYPGDPATKSFLRFAFDRVFGFPPVVRLSWQTAQKFFHGKNSSEPVWSDELDDEEAESKSFIPNSRSIKQFMKRSSADIIKESCARGADFFRSNPLYFNIDLSDPLVDDRHHEQLDSIDVSHDDF